MDKIYSIDYRDGITHILFSQVPTFTEIKLSIDDMAENHPYERRLWDFTNIDFNLSFDDLKRLAVYGKSKFTKPNRMAIVAPKDLGYGMARVFEAYRSEGNGAARVFRRRDDAIAWLKAQLL